MTAAIFKATYADWKVVKTRGVVQIIFEVPLSDEGAAYKVLGGMPDPAKERWFAIAALNPEAANKEGGGAAVSDRRTKPETTPRPLEPGGGVKKGPVWDVIRHCKDVRFQAFAHEKWKDAGMWPLAFKGNESKDNPEDVTAAIIRNWCAVETRADIHKYSHSRAQWDRLAAEYHAETVMA